MRRLVAIATAVATAIAIVLVLIVVDFGKILPTLQQLRPETIALVTMLLMVNLVPAFFRFQQTLSALGASVGWRPAAYAFSLGTLAGQFLLNVVGQSLTRAMALRSAGVPMSVTVFATYVERLVALGTLGVAAVVAALFLFGSLGFELHAGGAYLLSLGIGVSMTLGIAGGRAVASAMNADWLRDIVSTMPRLIPTVVMGMLAHLTMFAAYLILALDFSAGVDIAKLAAAIILVMFAAGIPISWAGWGLREFSAVYALSAVGVSTEAAVIIAVTIGILSLLVTLGATSIAVIDGWRRPIPRDVEEPLKSGLASADSMLFWPVGVLVACLVFFQLRVPTGADEITLNIADPLAITAFFFAVYLAWRGGFLQHFPPIVICSVCVLAGVLLLGAFVTWLELGLTEWILLNRLLGFLVLLGYASIAGLVVLVSSERGRVILADTFVASALVICAIEIVAYLIHLYVVPLPPDFFGPQFAMQNQLEGYAQNPNAFAFQLLMAACVLIAFHPPMLRRPAIPWSMLGVAAILAVVVIVKSRAGILCGLAMSLLAIALYLPICRSINRKHRMIALVALAIATAAGFEFRSSINELIIQPFNEKWRGNADASDMLRWETTSTAFKQWLEHPIFGHGLGSFLLERHRAGLTPLVIHSVPLWFLAEMGVIGLMSYMFFVAALLSWGITRIRENEYARGMVIAVTLFVLMGLVHDIFFQRTFWFGIGLMLASTTAAEFNKRGLFSTTIVKQ